VRLLTLLLVWVGSDPLYASLPVSVDHDRYHSLLPLASDQSHPALKPHAVIQEPEYKATVSTTTTRYGGTSVAHAHTLQAK